ncbi:MAG TPA: 3-oxoacyl-ACP reductase family protein [Acidobacteriota bacterium]
MSWNNSDSLSGQVALVTGASRGIGRCIALDLAHMGAAVVVHYLSSAQEAERVVQAICASGGRAVAVRADVGEPADVRRLHDAAVNALGPVDILVNNASIAGAVVPGFDVYLRTTPEEFDRMMRVNVGGAFFCSQAVLPSMIKRRQGTIVTISSGTGLHGGILDEPPITYAASKAAEVGFTKSLAKNVSRYGIRVNCVAPGLIDNTTFESNKPPKVYEGALLGRSGYPQEVSAAVSFLCSPRAAYITGQVLCVNGGNYLH